MCSLESLSFKSSFLNTDVETKEDNRTKKLEQHQDHNQLNEHPLQECEVGLSDPGALV